MSLMTIYLQFAAASYLFIMIFWLMDEKVRGVMKKPSWMIGFGLGTILMAIFWFLYVPVFVMRKNDILALAHKMLDEKGEK